MNVTDTLIILFGLSTAVWMGELSKYFANKHPRFILLGIFSVFIFIISTIEYLILRLTNLFSPGLPTFLFAVDSAFGMLFIASIDLICAFYLLFPFLKLGLLLLPREVAKEISIFKKTPSKGIGAQYVLGAFTALVLTDLFLLPLLSLAVFGTCNEPFDVLCARFSVFTFRSANYLTTSISLNEVFAKFLVVIGALTAILSVIQTSIEVYKAFKKK